MNSARSHIPKAPIYNPYDKFPQRDFDAWIDGITGTLRKALQHDEEKPKPPAQEKWYYKLGEVEENQLNGYGEGECEYGSSGEEQQAEAEIHSRRVKGKARDPREGPGLAAGTLNEPIELESDDEDVAEEMESNEGAILDEEEYEDENDGREYSVLEMAADSAAESHLDEEEEMDGFHIESDEEGARESQDTLEEIGSSLPAVARKTISTTHVFRAADDIDEVDVIDEEQPVSDNTAFPVDFELEDSQPLNLRDLWEGPKTYAEDYYSGGDFIRESDSPLNPDYLSAFDDKANDSGLFLTPGLLTPNGGNAISPSASDHALAQSPRQGVSELVDIPVNGYEEEENDVTGMHGYSPIPGSTSIVSPELEQNTYSSPILGSSPIAISRELEDNVNGQQSPQYIISDDEEEEEERHFDMHLGSSPPPAFDEEDDFDAGDTEDKTRGDLLAEVDVDIDAHDFLPLGTSDLGIDMENLEAEGNNEDEVETNEAMMQDSEPVLDDPAPLAQYHADIILNPSDTTDALEGLEKVPSPIPESENVLPVSQAEEPIVEMESEHVKKDTPLPSHSPIATDSPLFPPESPTQDADYTVIEIQSDEDVDGDADDDFDVESVAPPTDYTINHYDYEVEEVMTQGRLTAEPMDSASMDNVDEPEELGPLPNEEDLQGEHNTEYPEEDERNFERLKDQDQALVSEEVEEDVHMVTEEQEQELSGTMLEQVPTMVVDSESATHIHNHSEAVDLSQTSTSTSLDAHIPSVEAFALVGDSEVQETTPLQPSSIEASASEIINGDPEGVHEAPEHLPDELIVPDGGQLPVPEIINSKAEEVHEAPEHHGGQVPDSEIIKSKAEEVHEAIEHRSDDLILPDSGQPSDYDTLPPQSTVMAVPSSLSETESHTSASFSESITTTIAPVEPHSFVPDLTRKAIPVLHADPYPASLSTPDVYEEEEEDEGIDEIVSENEGDSSISSVEQEREKTQTDMDTDGLATPAIAVLDVDEDEEIELHYPPLETSGTPQAGTIAVGEHELDSDAEGDVDPEFATDSGRSGAAPNKDVTRLVDEEMRTEEERLEPFAPTSLAPASLSHPADAQPHPSTRAESPDSIDGMDITSGQDALHNQQVQDNAFQTAVLSVFAAMSTFPPIQAILNPQVIPPRAGEPSSYQEQTERIVTSVSTEQTERIVTSISAEDDANELGAQEAQSSLNGAAVPSTLAPETAALPREADAGVVPDEKLEQEEPYVQSDYDQPTQTAVPAVEDPVELNRVAHSWKGDPVQTDAYPANLSTPNGLQPASLIEGDVVEAGSTRGDTLSPVNSKKSTGSGSHTRKSKRKRKAPVTSQTSFGAGLESDNSQKKPLAKDKGKKKEVVQDVSDTASTSSASAAAKMLTGSRASSILSTSTGDGSVQTPPSPTLRAKDALSTNARIPAPPPPPPLPQVMFHNHSRKAPIRPTLTLQTQLQRTIARAPSFQPNKTPASQQLSSPVSGPSNSLPSSPAPVQSPNVLRREPSSNSPVTRSHCRYHKISLLEEDDGGHIYFLVPGCSLVDRKLIKEEEIKDHGDATYEDSTRKVADIETLGINDYVISVIRMLVGPDKEHEVYFLPKPGEERARRVTATHHRSNLSRSSITASNSSNVFASPRTSHANNNAFSPSSSSMAAPVSAAGSSSTNRSQRSRRQPQDREAESSLWSEAETSTDTDGEDSDGDYDGPPESKKQKLAHLSEGAEPPSQDLPQSQSQGPSQDESASASAGPGPRSKARTKAARRRRLDKAAAEYVPEEDGAEVSDEESRKPKKSKKNSLKRARTSEVGPTVPAKRTKTTRMIPYEPRH